MNVFGAGREWDFLQTSLVILRTEFVIPESYSGQTVLESVWFLIRGTQIPGAILPR